MTVLLVILTFFLLCAAGSIIEHRKRVAEKKRVTSPIIQAPVFAQDGGEPVDKKEENKKNEG